MPHSILVAEDDPIYRSFIRDALLESTLAASVILEAADGLAAVEIADSENVSCVVLDLQLPRLSGVDAARRIWNRAPETRILFWSNYADEAYLRSLARIVPTDACYGYVLKSTSPLRLRAALEGVFVQEQCIIDREIRGIQARAESGQRALSNAEYDMLMDISLGFTDQAIATRHGLSTRGVQSRLQKLYAKLGTSAEIPAQAIDPAAVFNPRTRAICVAILRGLINTDLINRADIHANRL